MSTMHAGLVETLAGEELTVSDARLRSRSTFLRLMDAAALYADLEITQNAHSQNPDQDSGMAALAQRLER